MEKLCCQIMARPLHLQKMSRGYNILVEDLPDYVTLYDVKYPVFTSFKNWIKISLMAERGGLNDAKEVAKMLKLCYREKLPPNIVSAVLGMITFLNGDTDFSVSSDKKKSKRIYSFFDDANAIYATFYSKYGVDLTKEDMHWYKFCSLFEGLTEDNPFKTLLKIRTTDEKEIKNAKSRRRIKELKAKYNLENGVEIDVAENISSLF